MHGSSNAQNGPFALCDLPGQICNQSATKVQSAAVPPLSEISNQLSCEMNAALHLSPNHNNPLIVSGPQSCPGITPDSSAAALQSSNIQLQHPLHHPQQNAYLAPQNNAGQFHPPPAPSSMPFVMAPAGAQSFQLYSSPFNSQTVSHITSTKPSPQGGGCYAVMPMTQQNSPVQSRIQGREGFSQQVYSSGGQMSFANNINNGPLVPSNNQPSTVLHSHPPTSSAMNGVQGNGQQTFVSQYSHPGITSTSNKMGSLPQPPVQNNRRLDPDNMPSPIQVIEDDRRLRSNSFVTNQKGQVPPLVTTNFSVFDEGICSPRFIRSTIYSVPTTADMLKQTWVPFAIAISPFARQQEKEAQPPVTNPGDDGPVRCNRCKAYMSPFMQFIDAGRRFQCVFCKATSEVPLEYFDHLDHIGERIDKYSRPELCLGSYEFIANKDYCKNGKFPNCPAFIFLIDVSYNSIRSGMVKTLCDNMKHVLELLPREGNDSYSKIRVGFITYSTVVHFYNINNNLAQPQMLVVSDVQDMFMPFLDGFLVNVGVESQHILQSLMEQIPTMFAETKETETILGPAIQAGLEALKAADCAGKLFVFHSTLPIAEAPGKLKNRDDRKLLGTDKEKAILNPQTSFYNNLGQDCISAGCCVDLFLFNNAYIDVATLGQVCRLTGGQVYKYTYFQSDIDGDRFIEDLKHDIGKPIAFDAVLRVRTSTGIRPTDFIGNFFMSNTTDVELGAIDCDKSITVEIKYDDKLCEEDGVFIQCAILFTSCAGQRKLRIHNLALNTCSQMADLFRNCELDTIMNVFLKEGVRMLTEVSPKQVKEHFISRSAHVLACYRKNCAQASSAGQLILPECMKLLPLYINCLIKCDAIAGGQEITTDDRSFIMNIVLSMDVNSSAAYLYPRLLPLHHWEPKSGELPLALRCSIERIKEYGVYLLENGISMFLWIGINANSEWIQEVFGVSSVGRIDVDKTQLLQYDMPLSQVVRAVVEHVQNERQRYMKLYVVHQGDKMELIFRQLLVEDRTTDGSASYVDFLCHLHKEIRAILS